MASRTTSSGDTALEAAETEGMRLLSDWNSLSTILRLHSLPRADLVAFCSTFLAALLAEDDLALAGEVEEEEAVDTREVANALTAIVVMLTDVNERWLDGRVVDRVVADDRL